MTVNKKGGRIMVKKEIEIVDQDTLQLKDETNKPWVEAWVKAVKKNED